LPKLHQIRSLLEKLVPDHKNERLVLNTVHIKNRVLGSEGSTITTLSAGGTYGHSVELLRNYAIWPVIIQVESSLADSQQLSFQLAPNKWEFSAELLPNHGLGPRTEVLYCRQRVSGKDEIFTKFTCNSGHADTMTLGINIE
jgi:hypothetical protein